MTQPHHIEELLTHADWMDQFAHRLCTDGEDLVQDTWLASLDAKQPRPDQQRAWLGTVMRNAFRMRRKSSKRRNAREEAAPDFRSAPSPEELTQKAQVQRRLSEHLQGLEPMHRDVVLLHFSEGLSAAEIGRRCGLPPRTVHSRLTRAIEILRGRLDEESGGDREVWKLALTPLLLDHIHKPAAGTAGMGALLMKGKAAVVALVLLLCGLGGALALGAFEDNQKETSRIESLRAGRGLAPQAGQAEESVGAADCTLRGTARDLGDIRLVVQTRYNSDTTP